MSFIEAGPRATKEPVASQLSTQGSQIVNGALIPAVGAMLYSLSQQLADRMDRK